MFMGVFLTKGRMNDVKDLKNEREGGERRPAGVVSMRIIDYMRDITYIPGCAYSNEACNRHSDFGGSGPV